MDNATLTTIVITFFGFCGVGLLAVIAFFSKEFYKSVKAMGIKLDTKVMTIAACEVKEGKVEQEIHELANLIKALVQRLPVPRPSKKARQ